MGTTKVIVLYCVGMLLCIPALLSAFFELPHKGWWDLNETYFVMLSLLAPVFFYSAFHFFKKGGLLMNILMVWGVYLTIPDVNLLYADQLPYEFKEPVFSIGAIVCFSFLTLWVIWNRESIGLV